MVWGCFSVTNVWFVAPSTRVHSKVIGLIHNRVPHIHSQKLTYCWWKKSGSPVEVGSLSHYLQGFVHPRWCRISSINSSTWQEAGPQKKRIIFQPPWFSGAFAVSLSEGFFRNQNFQSCLHPWKLTWLAGKSPVSTANTSSNGFSSQSC